ncbi:hypothetical protein FA95DRAFT_1628815 [Auriscalpium vulgare]|uniref:Uncharacterized protein n=1 Tax=Auriscalpium vulgare TaxID=40419 RepID=A0ACB8RHH3_9AGAM|nr:hypothetical protein FA95DRAFT_1628815 [Auriscalpium vulgare]
MKAPFSFAQCVLVWAIAATAHPSNGGGQLPLQLPQIAAQSTGSWNTPPHPDATHNHLFNQVNSLMKRWPNTIYRNGHAIVAATIPTGTILYHGRTNSSVPNQPEWLGFDFEHSYLFCWNSCFVMSIMATRDLHLAYFDGTSAANLQDGTLDSQDIVIWGERRTDKFFSEYERINELCKWGRPLGVDGFVRMEFHFEVLLCDFTDGVEVVSISNVLPKHMPATRPRMPPPGRDSDFPPPPPPPHDIIPHRAAPFVAPPTRRPFPQPDPPPNWKGSLPDAGSITFEALVAGSWHNTAPGETRVRVDYARVVSFYDPALSSLVEARRGLPRAGHHLGNLSTADSQKVRAELAEVFARRGGGSGVDWGSVTRVVVERYADRLELLRYLLAPARYPNATEQAALVRKQLLTALAPYITVDTVPTADCAKSNTSWAAPIVERCATTQTGRILDHTLTEQERLIRDAVEGTLREACRRLTGMWVEAFDIERETDMRKREVLQAFATEVEELMTWLDWSVWVKCRPECNPDQMCYIPSWFFYYWLDKDPNDMTPRCISKLETSSF